MTPRNIVELTSSVPIPDITRLRLRHHVAFWNALSSTAPKFRANCCSRSVWLRASPSFGSSGKGRKDASIHADMRVSIFTFMHGVGPGWQRTEREDKADAEKQDLPVLASEERVTEIVVEGGCVPYAVAHATSLICAETRRGVAAERAHVRSGNENAVYGLDVVG
jgi:hypothetical protein